ncbi:MAG: hypothetical protein AUK48_04735 [Oscillatoriales cyanobacterium CG2_30_44_21]|nr:MAG: hypothetical protein AUK48_04735 [Oscillatoriales cyanobacterium CG2_30_44_21]
MTQDDYLARIDQRLENLVSQIGNLLEYLHTDSISVKVAVFGLGDYLQESNDRMARIENTIAQQAEVAKAQADAAKTQAENIRLMIEMVNRKQA